MERMFYFTLSSPMSDVDWYLWTFDTSIVANEESVQNLVALHF